jgi:hypothetical protein
MKGLIKGSNPFVSLLLKSGCQTISCFNQVITINHVFMHIHLIKNTSVTGRRAPFPADPVHALVGQVHLFFISSLSL